MKNIAKKISVLLVLAAFLLTAMSSLAVGATDTDTEKGHYLWNFEDASLNDDTNGVYIANTGNNKLTKVTVDDASFPDNAVASGVEQGAYVADSEKEVVNSLGKALWAAGVYFNLENSFTLESDKAWYISLSGRLPNGEYNANPDNTLPDTAMFAGDNVKFTIDGTGLAATFTKTAGGVDTNYKLKDDEHWPSGARIGQNRKQTLELWNEFDTTANVWKIHWKITRYYGTDEWDGVDCSTPTPVGVDFTFNSIGSAVNYFGANRWGENVGNFGTAYISEIEIFEDLGTYTGKTIESVPAGIITSPVEGVAFSRTLNLGDLEGKVTSEIKWTNSEGVQKSKASAGNTYIATVKLTPVLGYSFGEATVIPEEYTATLGDDGVLTLTKTFVMEGEAETEAPDTTDTAAPETTAAADSAEDVAAEDKGCGSTVATGALAITAICSVALIRKKSKEQ